MNRVPRNLVPSLFDYAADTEAAETSDHTAPDRAEALIDAAKQMLEVLVAGDTLSHDIARDCMTEAFGASDTTGAWQWKDLYEAQEIAGVLFLRRYSKAIRERTPAQQLATMDKLQSLMLTHTRRSDTSLRYQQFSTPFVLARACALAAQIDDNDVVLEPSAGTGILAINAEINQASLYLNEYERGRAALLAKLFACNVHQYNAEYISDYLAVPDQPSIVLMNPPFTNSPTMHKTDIGVTGRHVISALRCLRDGGRMVAITGHNFAPTTAPLRQAFTRLQQIGTIIHSVPLAGKFYYKHGTSFATRLTVIDKIPAEQPDSFPHYNDLVIDDFDGLVTMLDQLPQRPALGEPKRLQPNTQPTATAKPVAVKSIEESPQINFTTAVALTYTVNAPQEDDGILSDALYSDYQPQTININDAKPHPTRLVQSSAMNAVRPPVPTAQPMLPPALVSEGILSAPQLESIVYAEEAHAQHLPGTIKIDKHFDIAHVDEETLREVTLRRGWFLGDGTGCGKGRQIAGMIVSNVAQGRKRAIWVSKNDKLIEDARRDWQAVGGDPKQIVPLSKFALGKPIDLAQGILFVTYGTLRIAAKQGKCSRVEQIVNWAGEDFDGIIAFDESHAMANAGGLVGARGVKGSSQQALTGLKLQRALHDARVVYVSATGATEVGNLAYAERLGLWGEGTAFAHRSNFVAQIEKGGIAAMEVISRDLKAMGLYTARALSYAGVTVDMLEHQLTEAQIAIYNRYADAYQVIHHNIGKALNSCNITDDKGTPLNSQSCGNTYSAFEGNKQRFFNHLLTAMKCPSLIAAMQHDLENNKAPVVQIVSTSEALLQRRLDAIPTSEWSDLNIDITPREYVMDYLVNSFPIQLHELYQDEKGKTHSRPVYDAEGKPVINQAALAKRDALISDLASLPPVPAALDQIMHHFGDDQVAEVTGRSIRLINKDGIISVHKRSASANVAETHAFMQGKKSILVFSDAGGTGRSYHADLNAENQKQRVHYLLEAGWRADNAIQGLGRTHRTHQASAPIFRPVATDVAGEKRFLSTIARRLDTLGAMTKGQRQTGGQGMFRSEDNLEADEARQAMITLMKQITMNMIEGCSMQEFEDMTGLKLDKEESLPSTAKFLNRLLALRIETQNMLYDHFSLNLAGIIEEMKEAGQYNIGIETLKADHFTVVEHDTVWTDQATQAESYSWLINQQTKTQPISQERALREAGAHGRLVINTDSGYAAIIVPTEQQQVCQSTGALLSTSRLIRPTGMQKMTNAKLDKSHWREASQTAWHQTWQEQIDHMPEYQTKQFLMITGMLLSIWHLIGGQDMKIYRLKTDDGQVLLGRKLEGAEISKFRQALGLGKTEINSNDILAEVKQGGSFTLAQGLRLKRSLVMGQHRLEIITPGGNTIIDQLITLGCFTEIIAYQRRTFIPDTETADEVIAAIIEQFPLIES